MRFILLFAVTALIVGCNKKVATTSQQLAQPPVEPIKPTVQPQEPLPKKVVAPNVTVTPKKETTVTTIEQLVEKLSIGEENRLKLMNKDFNFLPERTRRMIEKGRQAINNGDWKTMPGDEFSIYRTHSDYFHRGQLAKMFSDAGKMFGSESLIKSLKIQPGRDLYFEQLLGRMTRLAALSFRETVEFALKNGLDKVPDDQKRTLIPFKEFLGELTAEPRKN